MKTAARWGWAAWAAVWMGVGGMAPQRAWADEWGAEVGKVSSVMGVATRTPPGGKPETLREAVAVRLEDTLHVRAGANLKVTLQDGSVIALGEGSELKIARADFGGQTRTGFLGQLRFGTFWGKVKKALAGSNAKFEVETERAVAGVRGTIFRVQAVKAVLGKNVASASTVVRVVEGKVAVEERRQANAPKAPKKGRKQVQGPTQLGKDEYERRIAELQQGMEIRVGDGLWEEARFDPALLDSDPLFQLVRGDGATP